MEWVCYNGDFFPAGEPIFSLQHKGIKYGDGVFETMKVYKGNILLVALHFERLFISLQLLQIDPKAFDRYQIEENILSLCSKNNCLDSARVRLTIVRNETAEYLIEAFPLSISENALNHEGWKIGIFPFARKNVDAYANIKSISYQLYVLAQLYAKEKTWDEAIVLNAFNHIADGSKTNVFLIKDNEIFTPALHQGCVNGVMRRFLIDELKKKGYRVHQAEVTEKNILLADEIFCTNAIRGMRWVSQFNERNFGNEHCLKIYNNLVSTIYQ